MNLRILFVISAILQLSSWGYLLSLGVSYDSVAFYVLEVLTIVNIIYLIYFYRKVHRPIQALSDGLDLLKGQDWNATLNKVGQSEVDKIAETFNKMIAMLKDERLRFEEQSHFLNLLIARAPIGVIIMNFNGTIHSANQSAAQIFKATPDDIAGVGLEVLPGNVGTSLVRLKIGETSIIRTVDGATLKCSCYNLIDKGVAHKFYLIEDVGDALAEAERAAYEKIIRIIAHEVNNTVAPIASSINVVSDIIDTSEETIRLLQSCSERALGMSEFVSRLAEVVKIPDPVLLQCDLNAMIRRNRPFLESLCLPAGCRLDFVLDDTAPICMADVALIEQCIVNIVKNAVESITLTSRPGEISISTSKSEKGGLLITIADNGGGISQEKSLKIFTPFFTDKPNGQGVGLTFVREVLRRHRCSHSLATSSDGLTRFNIEFPRLQAT